MAAKPRTPTAKANPDPYRVRIRMYRQGLGDCFLLSFPIGEGQHTHVLIDCGVVLGTGEPGVVMKQVAQDIDTTTGGKIDVLVVTHEHWDHLSGFDPKQAGSIFARMEIGELWLAWTEDETDDLARGLREERERKKAAAKAAKDAAGKRGQTDRSRRIAALLGFFGATGEADGSEEADGGGGTAGALKFLKAKCRPTILETGSSRPLPGPKEGGDGSAGMPREPVGGHRPPLQEVGGHRPPLLGVGGQFDRGC